MTRYLKQYTYDLPPASFFNASNRGYPDLALAADDIALVFTAFDFLGGGDEGIADSESSEDSEGSAKSTTTDEKKKKEPQTRRRRRSWVPRAMNNAHTKNVWTRNQRRYHTMRFSDGRGIT